MHLGVDLGTTRTIVAAVDRGNYPVVTFLDDDGDAHESFPSVVALQDDRLLYGFDALAAGATGAPLLRSFKRALAEPDVNADTAITVGDREISLLEILTGYLDALRHALLTASNLPGAGPGREGQDLEGTVVIAVPAHAHGAQRFLTLEAFRRARFDVAAMLNEPSAAGFEYTHRRGGTVTSRRTRVVVYDLGGGTFDASLVDVEGTGHDVLATAGLNRLGGDDFDAVLVRCALEAADLTEADLDARSLADLRDQCREAKERITPQSRRIALEVGDRDVNVAVDDFYDAAGPLVEATMAAMGPVLGGLDDPAGMTDVAGIYLVGGGSGLPLVPRLLKERFGRRVHRSPHPSASTAIGLAIAADPESRYSLTDRLSRGFGVFREQRGGQGVTFDPILTPDAALPDPALPGAALPDPALPGAALPDPALPGAALPDAALSDPALADAALPDAALADAALPDAALAAPQQAEKRTVVATRRYRAAHNIGWFRFVECSTVDDAGEPRGDIVPFAEVLFPFDPALRDRSDLTGIPVRRQDGCLVEERYVIDRNGIVEVHITDLDTGFGLHRTIAGRAAPATG